MTRKKTSRSLPKKGSSYLVMNYAITPSSGVPYEGGSIVVEGQDLSSEEVRIYLGGGDIVDAEEFAASITAEVDPFAEDDDEEVED